MPKVISFLFPDACVSFPPKDSTSCTGKGRNKKFEYIKKHKETKDMKKDERKNMHVYIKVQRKQDKQIAGT